MASGFVKGTLILTIAGFVVKAIGSINWILLSRILGGEGIGIYQMAFPIYLLLLQISSAGVPIAISILTAERLALHDFWWGQTSIQSFLYYAHHNRTHRQPRHVFWCGLAHL